MVAILLLLLEDIIMQLWLNWFSVVWQLKGAFSRTRTFTWFVIVLIGFSIRHDMLGVTSIIRATGLDEKYYDNLLDFFHSKAVKTDVLTSVWTQLAFKIFSPVLVNGRYVLCADGIKVAKEGKKMPGVKRLHQESESNKKAEYIMGHSCQAIGLVVNALSSFFCVPLACRIHEGVVFSNRDKRTLLDKMIILFNSLGVPYSCYFVADAYYASRKTIAGLVKNGHHLVSRMKTNAVAYYPLVPITENRPVGRPKKYGKRIKLWALFQHKEKMSEIQSPVYGEKNVTLLCRSIDLLWKPTASLIRFILVIHPHRGQFILMTTDLSAEPVDVIKMYGLRFKIEVSFKQAVYTLGTYGYHFWSKDMKPIKGKSGNQYLHRESDEYRTAIRRKLAAYHNYIQVSIIAQGLLQYLSAASPKLVWSSFGSWLRTIRPGICPSEMVTAMAMRNTFSIFLVSCHDYPDFTKFLAEHLDFSRADCIKLAG